jgi:hypothetical protein
MHKAYRYGALHAHCINVISLLRIKTKGQGQGMLVLPGAPHIVALYFFYITGITMLMYVRAVRSSHAVLL